MKTFFDLNDPGITGPTILTLGVFDGLHLGHQAIMKQVADRALETGCIPTVITFDPHPRAVLHPETAPPLLQTIQQRIEGMGILGIRQVLVLPFTRELAALTADEFIEHIIFERLRAREVYLGKGFAFGRNRGGKIETLKICGERFGFTAEEVGEVLLRGRRISSTMIRRLIRAGRVTLARRMLGRPYGVEGKVVEGRKLGRTLSFPTANLEIINRVVPADGVYVTASLIDGTWRRSVTNVGVRPTVGGELNRVVETHVLDYSGDLYGQNLRTRFLHRLRDEKKFSGLDALRAQINRDAERARKYFEHTAVRKNLAVS
ncbi:MAG: bifunctional riboflavin kinase/FAD synthetase [Blastocatellia bacterium]|nr:bifunctional riboflavin kinase/FAD synthetase [Blastocatellia bacterium]